MTRYTKTNHMQKVSFLTDFTIFLLDLVVANLKWISCSLTELWILFMLFCLSSKHAKWRIISNSANFLRFHILSPGHVFEGQRSQHLVV